MWASNLCILTLLALPAADRRYEGPDEPKSRKPSSKEVLAKLDQVIPLHFEGSPLEDVLGFIHSATEGPGEEGIRFAIEPVRARQGQSLENVANHAPLR